MPHTPEISREEMRTLYEQGHRRAVKKGQDPISSTMLSLLSNRYTLRRIYISEPIHRAEIVPFAMMEEHEGKERLIDYLMVREGLLAMMSDLKLSINRAFRDQIGVNAANSYETLLALQPFIRTANIWWLDWLAADVRGEFERDSERRQYDMAAPFENNRAPFWVFGISESSSVTSSVGEALIDCESAGEAILQCARLYRMGVRSFVIKDERRQTITMENLFDCASALHDKAAYRHLLS